MTDEPVGATQPMSADELDNMHAAWVAGYEYGLAERFRTEVTDAVHTALHAQARETTGMAQELAAAKGPAWAQMIRESGERA